ncbi:GNAT family N-acetyltransferase [Parvimonas parva]|uniref:GNAT family N-acetyltransferase n=1 Tax=Parvimonas parva TaxID=2769485 RepID=A0ABS1C7Z9_9FIRM|nr:GNAT family N-acetyltransferase [Parvimonas parva]MBK1468216.1 GNAT family N-acetyltransferase [Parvimonas parva]
MEFRILKTKEELKLAFALREEVFVDEQKVPLEYEVDEKDSLNNTLHVGVFEDGEILATARIMDFNKNVVRFGRACVKKSCRGKGVGKFLFINMEETVKNSKNNDEKKTIKFSAQYHAMTFYEMLGYSKYNDDVFVEVGIEHIAMSKVV